MSPRRRDRHPISNAELVGALGHWASGEDPLYGQLAAAIERATEDGSLPPGTVLPPQRGIAETLCVSRTTVISAIDRLKGDGVLHSRQGGGIWVGTSGPDAGIPARTPPEIASHRIRRLIREGAPGFRRTALDLGSTGFHDDPLAADTGSDHIAQEHEFACDDMAGAMAPTGMPDLRADLAELLTANGLETSPDQLCVTAGGHHSLWLLASTFVGPGQALVIEEPTWPGALDVLRSIGALPVPVEVDRWGVVVPRIEEAVARTRPAAILVTPEYHNPTGARLHEVRRAAIARFAGQHFIPVLEDCSLWGLSPDADGPRLRSIGSFDTAVEVITFGTLAKLVSSRLTVGWIRAPRQVIAHLAATKAATGTDASPLAQVAALAAIRRLEAIREIRNAQLRTSLDLVCSFIDQLRPAWSMERPAGGLSAWVEIPFGRALELSQVAVRHGLELWPGPVFSAAGGFERHLRIPLSLPAPRLAAGLDRLSQAWQDYARTARPETAAGSGARPG